MQKEKRTRERGGAKREFFAAKFHRAAPPRKEDKWDGDDWMDWNFWKGEDDGKSWDPDLQEWN